MFLYQTYTGIACLRLRSRKFLLYPAEKDSEFLGKLSPSGSHPRTNQSLRSPLWQRPTSELNDVKSQSLIYNLKYTGRKKERNKQTKNERKNESIAIHYDNRDSQ
jgi:hypothetical protein